MQSPGTDFIVWRIFGLEPARLSAFERVLLRVALTIGIIAVYFTFRDIRDYAGVDLRNRVVGARVMLAGYDPYIFTWESGMPDEWLDPVHDPKAHRLTVSPPTLLAYAIIAPAPYAAQRLFSFIAEWLALVASLALLSRCLPEQRHRTVFLIGATLFVIVTDVWRLHVERGQIYVFHLLALSIAIYCSRSGLVDSPAAGVALGALCLLRPNWLVLAPALLVLRQWRCAGSLAATAVVGGALTFAVLPASSWQNYLDVGDQYYRLIQDWESVPDRPAPTDHRWAEGVNFDCALRNVASSSFAIVWRIMHERYGLPMVDLALVSKLMLGGLAVVLLAFLGRRRGESAFALMIVIGMDTEFFLPHRWGYADVMLLAPLALLLPSLMQNPTARGIVVVGLICGTLGQPLIGLQTATILRSWLVMGVLTGLALANIACWKSVEDGKETQA